MSPPVGCFKLHADSGGIGTGRFCWVISNYMLMVVESTPVRPPLVSYFKLHAADAVVNSCTSPPLVGRFKQYEAGGIGSGRLCWVVSNYTLL
jgi:hypothetical protein